jgi:hypothetical protein
MFKAHCIIGHFQVIAAYLVGVSANGTPPKGVGFRKLIRKINSRSELINSTPYLDIYWEVRGVKTLPKGGLNDAPHALETGSEIGGKSSHFPLPAAPMARVFSVIGTMHGNQCRYLPILNLAAYYHQYSILSAHALLCVCLLLDHRIFLSAPAAR